MRARRTGAVTEDREINLPELGRVAMRAPDDDLGQAAMLRFERGQIANASFIEPAVVVDDEDVARLRTFHRLKEDVDAPEVSDREDMSGESLPGNHKLGTRRGGAGF